MKKKRKVNIYNDLRGSLADALRHERGQGAQLRGSKIDSSTTKKRKPKIQL
jgi:hypothetical protein